MIFQLRLKHLFLAVVCIFLSFTHFVSSKAANSPTKKGWFSKLKMGNAATRAISYSISKNEANAITVLEFKGTRLSWFRLDDGVMGGKSETVHVAEDGILRFEGQINTNGGGFASIRAKLPDGLLTAQTEGVRIKYRGDGKTYKMLLSNGKRGGPFSRTPSWQIDLPTIDKSGSEEWDEATILFAELLLAFGGGPRSQLSEEQKKEYKFDASEMEEVGIMLSLRLSNGSPNPVETFGEGIFSFSLLIQSITAIE